MLPAGGRGGTDVSRAELSAMVRRNAAHARAGTIDAAAGVMRLPSSVYVDPGRFEAEVAGVFRRLPLVLGLSADLAEPGRYTTVEAAGVPVLLVRGTDGEVRGFVNMCSHRGAQVAEGRGSTRRFACPYHAWSYDREGTLVGIFGADDFGDVDRSCLGLTALSVEERAGLVWGTLVPGAGCDLDGFLAGYDGLLDHLGLADCTYVDSRVLEGPNWKVAYDGYLDFYHLPVLHRETFGPDLASRSLFDAYGPHQRVTVPNARFAEWEDTTPEHRWRIDQMVGGVWTVFPHVSIAGFDAGGHLWQVAQLFPGETVDRSRTILTWLAVGAVDDERRELIAKTIDFLVHVVRDEDYATGLRLQQAVRSGAKPELLFGRNESGGQRFHGWVDAVLGTPDDELDDLFRRGLPAP